jgi:hypothetical protein
MCLCQGEIVVILARQERSPMWKDEAAASCAPRGAIVISVITPWIVFPSFFVMVILIAPCSFCEGRTHSPSSASGNVPTSGNVASGKKNSESVKTKRNMMRSLMAYSVYGIPAHRVFVKGNKNAANVRGV